jgi:Ser/Thr protein kinase RdoA (MazF antagonist)
MDTNLELLSDWNHKVYRDGDRVLKVFENATFEYIEQMVQNLRFIYDSGIPTPKVYGIRRINDTETALETEYLAEKPFDREGIGAEERKAALREVIRLQRVFAGVNAPHLPDFTAYLRSEIKRNRHLSDKTKEAVDGIIVRLDKGKTAFCHGDVHTRNFLYDGERLYVIDCENPFRGDPAADACMMYFYEMRFKPAFAEFYLNEFCAATGIGKDELLAWLPVIAAYQSDINDDKDRAFILKTLDMLIAK